MARDDDERPVAAPESPPPATPRRAGIGALGVGGWVLLVLAVVLALGGGSALAVHLTQRDDDGYYTSSTERVASPGYAVTASGFDLNDATEADVVRGLLGRVRVRVDRAGDAPVFVGIARTADLDRYLAGVGRSEVTDVSGGDISYRVRAGGAPPTPPAEQRFWQASASGPGQQATSWDVDEGNWSVAVMNPGGTRGVSADVSVGAKTSALL